MRDRHPRPGVLCRAASASTVCPRCALARAHQTRHRPGAVERATASRRPATLAMSVSARSSGRTGGHEAADRKLGVSQDRVDLELDHGVGAFGELRGALRASEVLAHVAGQPAQSPVGREQERVTGLVVESLGDRARFVEEAAGLTLLDARDAADLQQRDAGGELECQGLRGLGAGGEQCGDPTAVSHPGRRVTPGDAPARLFVPAGCFQPLAGLVEVVSEERGVHPGCWSVDREQGSRDRGVGGAAAILKLRAVGDLLREGMPEGVLPRRSGAGRAARRSRGARAPRRARARVDRPRRVATLIGTSRPITAAAWSTSLSRSASRSIREARTA